MHIRVWKTKLIQRSTNVLYIQLALALMTFKVTFHGEVLATVRAHMLLDVVNQQTVAHHVRLVGKLAKAQRTGVSLAPNVNVFVVQLDATLLVEGLLAQVALPRLLRRHHRVNFTRSYFNRYLQHRSVL